MPETYTLAKVRYQGEKPNPRGGTLHKHYIVLRDASGTEHGTEDNIYWQSKSQHNVGEQVYGHIEPGEFGPRFKADQKPDGSGSQGSSGGTFTASRYQKEGMTKDEFWDDKRQRDIESQARQGRAHAQEMCLRWFDLRDDDRPAIPTEADSLLTIIDWFHDDVQRFPIDADVGGGSTQAIHDAPPVAADVSADRYEPVDAENRALVEQKRAEASPAQKGKLTTLMGKAGLSRDAMKAVVLFRCRSERATKDGASKLIQDLMDGATHDTLLAEIHDAKRAGDPLAIRAAALIPSDTPLAEPEPEEKAQEYEDESGVPF